MEEEKRKKKNRKKKNKQQGKVSANETASNAGDTSSGEQSHVSNMIVQEKGGNEEVANGSISEDNGKQNWLQEEARLREMVKQLLYEKDSITQRQADLEIKAKTLQCENDSWRMKEVSLGQRISQLSQEKASLSVEESKLRERVRHIEKEKALLVEKENSDKENIAKLTNENTRLQMQVVELEGAKNSLSQENKQLLDNISTLQSRILNLERSLASAHSSIEAHKDVSEKEDLNAQIEAACALVEKLVTENAELVEKLNELYMEPGPRTIAPEVTSVSVPDFAPEHNSVPGPAEKISSSTKTAKLFETVPISDDVDSDYANVARHSSISGEIVQISLDENESRDDLEAQTSAHEPDESVPMTDAPLIGAPFRLVSFVAKYVSGADLVNKSSSQ